ncbi:hypothetical protein [Catenuloplanes nepalensis]|uniref:hypothetical protein n=1 Tax=Catenuloplanes nepalensis TaxID=587533 RepID=UPI0027D8AA2B|nr:hypothetical protein [Catenuloplanes nepalensis]
MLRDDSPAPVAPGDRETRDHTETFEGDSGHPRKESSEQANEPGYLVMSGVAEFCPDYARKEIKKTRPPESRDRVLTCNFLRSGGQI